MSINEARPLLGLNPLEGEEYDQVYLPSDSLQEEPEPEPELLPEPDEDGEELEPEEQEEMANG